MLSRKLFLKGSLVASASIGSMAHAAQLQRVSTLSAGEVASDEAFWQSVRAQYITGKLINLNNGGVNPQPQPVRDAYMHNYLLCNDTPSYSMWRELDKQREPLRKRLAELLGVSELEVAFNRNTTPVIDGMVTLVGADLLPAEKEQDEYYLAMIETTAQGLATLGGLEVQPGMPVEVIVKNGERTFMSYLVKPITDSFAVAFKD